MSAGRRKNNSKYRSVNIPGHRASQKPVPAELKEGLKPIPVGLAFKHDDRDLRAAILERQRAVFIKLETLRQIYGIADGPDCWRELSLALATEMYAGFRVKPDRKPKKWTVGVLMTLAGEMHRAMESGGKSTVEAAQELAGREPWRTFLSEGRWAPAKSKEREPWENLHDEYTRAPERYRHIGREAYLWNVHTGTLREWDEELRDLLDCPDLGNI
jgi:hypothetical protein